MDLPIAELRDTLLAIPRPTVVGILLLGSWARAQADSASDVDVMVVTDDGSTRIRTGRFKTWDVEVIYQPLELLRQHVPTRATLQGAKILTDRDGALAQLVEGWEEHFSQPRPVTGAVTAYAEWELRHGLRAFNAFYETGDWSGLWLLRASFADTLMAYLFDRSGTWPPTRRRQVDALDRVYPGIASWLMRLLSTADARELICVAHQLWDRWGAGSDEPLLSDAPLWAW